MKKAMDTLVILVWVLALVLATYAMVADRLSPLIQATLSIATSGASNTNNGAAHSPYNYTVSAPTVDTVSTPMFDKV